MGPLRIARWLLSPVVFVVCQWLLFKSPQTFLRWCVPLWEVDSEAAGAIDLLPPHPKSKSQSFELGRHFEAYRRADCGEAGAEQQVCDDALRRAGEVLGTPLPLTSAQLGMLPQLIADLDAQRSIVDRVLGFFSFVNVVWLISIVGVIATVGPAIGYLFGPMLLKLATVLLNNLLIPVVSLLHRIGAFEVAAYTLAFHFCVQGRRYSAGQADAGIMVALTGGLAFAPCWFYSTSLNVQSSGGNEDKFLMLTYTLASLVFVPMAVAHDSRLLGFLAVMAIFGAMGFVFFAFGSGFAIGFDSKDSMLRSAGTSFILVASYCGLRFGGLNPAYLRPFSTAVMVCGNIVYFLALLIFSGRWRRCDTPYYVRQGLMLGSLVTALFVGNVYSMQGMSNTASTFLVLWLMEKELEVKWGPGAGMLVLFLNFIFLYNVAHYLHTHPDYIVSIFEVQGMYM